MAVCGRGEEQRQEGEKVSDLLHVLVSIVETAWIGVLLTIAILTLCPPVGVYECIIGTALVMVSVEMIVNRCRRLTRNSNLSNNGKR